jgi:hypothetical protein
MTTTIVRVVGFLAALAVVFGAAMGLGAAVGPTPEPTASHGSKHDERAVAEREPAAPAEMPGGVMVAQDGYTLKLANQQADAGRDVPVAFTIEGPDSRPVTSYAVEHEKRLHLIAVRRDFTGFQHVHPELGERGVWDTRLDLTPGQWRLFADFQASRGPALTLGADLAVPGDYRPDQSSGESRTAKVDGYTVTLDGNLTPGSDAKLRLSVHKDGRPVTDLQPYLGAYGHLVALREGDLAYLHVHPDGVPGDGSTEPGPDVVFYAAVPSPGGYRLYLDFKHQGVVHTAAFTLAATGADTETSSGGDRHDDGARGGGHGGH